MSVQMQPEAGTLGAASLGAEHANPREHFEELKGQFLASLNHEMRTPLSGVLGMAGLLLETRLDEEQREYVTSIHECADQLFEILTALLDYSAWTAGSLRTTEAEFLLRPFLDSLANEFAAQAQAKGLRFAADFEPGLPDSLIGDERYLRQVLRQLLRNAVKFTHEGEVKLSLRMEATAGPSLVHQWVRFEVRDTGIGIPAEKLSAIFESFRQLDTGLARNFSGLGLGLALADKITTVMGGEILVESRPGSGSVFTMRVPLRLPAGTVWRLPEIAPVRLSGRRVLVVDDNKIAQQVISHSLKRSGFAFDFADGGEQAVTMAGESRYDLILMDMEMPDVDGLTATRRIRQLPGYARTPIIAVTANWSDDHRILCYRLGLQDFVSKPIDRSELLRKMEALLPRTPAPAAEPLT